MLLRLLNVVCLSRCNDVFAARGGRRDRGSGGGGGFSRGGASRGGGMRGGASRRGGAPRGQRGGRIGPMGGAGRPTQHSAMRSVVGSYTVPPPMSAGFTHGAHY